MIFFYYFSHRLIQGQNDQKCQQFPFEFHDIHKQRELFQLNNYEELLFLEFPIIKGKKLLKKGNF